MFGSSYARCAAKPPNWSQRWPWDISLALTMVKSGLGGPDDSDDLLLDRLPGGGGAEGGLVRRLDDDAVGAELADDVLRPEREELQLGLPRRGGVVGAEVRHGVDHDLQPGRDQVVHRVLDAVRDGAGVERGLVPRPALGVVVDRARLGHPGVVV